MTFRRRPRHWSGGTARTGAYREVGSIVRGFKLGTAYSELVDPVVQRERLVAQARLAAAGDPEAMRLDEDFLRAMEYGMPPTGGMGMGIDRLLMALTGYGITGDNPVPARSPRVKSGNTGLLDDPARHALKFCAIAGGRPFSGRN